MIKKAFWNLSVPGCNEHYFAHEVRKSEDFIPELDFVIEEDGIIIGHILYVKAKLIADDGTEKEILSFGSFTIHPDYQRKGYGRKLLNHSFEAAKKLGYDTIVIWGNPENYACYGFKNCKRYNVCLEEDVFPVALMVKVLGDNVLSEKSWKYIESPAHQLDESGFEAFDSSFEQMEKGYQYTQELFYIYSRSNVLR
ncbi:MAG: GNAT family N-acetyltransferase [Acetatifactor sp.]